MPTECSRDLFGYEVVEGRQVVAAFDGGQVTSDAGALRRLRSGKGNERRRCVLPVTHTNDLRLLCPRSSRSGASFEEAAGRRWQSRAPA
jgi:hypothetical protein